MRGDIPTLVKWAGGKKQLLEQFDPYFPRNIKRYIEPFVGGGSVAFHIIKKYNPDEVIISDINEELINTYNVVKTDVEKLIKFLRRYQKNHNKENYYRIRSKSPERLSEINRAARFIYLNKTCFNGLYRVNSKGNFNVPIGDNKGTSICMEEDLREISKLMKNVTVKLMPFEEIINIAKKEILFILTPLTTL